MKDYVFKINIGDILQKSSRNDTILFSEKFSTFLPQLIDPGISCTIHIQWMDRHSLLLVISNPQASVSYACDKCLKEFTHILSFPKKEVTCLFEEWSWEKEDDILYIHQKEKVIDIEHYLVESFLLEEEVIHLCENCEKNSISKIDEDEDNLWQCIHF